MQLSVVYGPSIKVHQNTDWQLATMKRYFVRFAYASSEGCSCEIVFWHISLDRASCLLSSPKVPGQLLDNQAESQHPGTLPYPTTSLPL